MTHDESCKFDPKYCSSCKLQAEARASERYNATMRVIAAYKAQPRKRFSFGNIKHTIEVYQAIKAIGAQDDFRN